MVVLVIIWLKQISNKQVNNKLIISTRLIKVNSVNIENNTLFINIKNLTCVFNISLFGYSNNTNTWAWLIVKICTCIKV